MKSAATEKITRNKNIRSSIRKHNKMRVLGPAVLLVAAVLLMTACSSAAEQKKPEPEAVENMYYYQGDDATAFKALQEEMIQESRQFAAAKLGSDPELAALLSEEEPDYYEADALLKERLSKTNLTESYPFLERIPSMRVICVDKGTNLYCIIPNENTGGLTVSSLGEQSETGYAKGEELFTVKGAYPILVFADNAYIEENGGAQTAVTIADGLITEDILTLQPKRKALNDEALTGLWKAEEIHDDAGAIFDLYLNFGQDSAFEYYYVRRDPGPWENQTVMHYTGTRTLMGGDRLEVNATADGGTYFDAGMKAFDVTGTYEICFIDEKGERLMLRHIGGDTFLTGIVETEIIFTKETE